jgi:hypothetical protein
MNYKQFFLLLLLLVSVNTFAQRPYTLHYVAKGGFTQEKLFNLDMSVLYKTKRNTTFSTGFDFYSSRPKPDPTLPHYNPNPSTNLYLALYFNIGKVIPTKNPRLFFHLQTGPSYTALFDDGGSDVYSFSLNTKGYLPIGLHSSAAVVYQPFKFMQVEAGINSNIAAVKSYGGLYLGIRFGGGKKLK